jgi:hypothetical protein
MLGREAWWGKVAHERAAGLIRIEGRVSYGKC